MKLKITDIIDTQKGRTGYVIGNGPSAKPIIEKLIQNRTENDIIFCCNDIDVLLTNSGYSLSQLQPNYWVLANNEATIQKKYQKFNEMKNYNGILLYADGIDFTKNVESLLTVDFVGYDQGHYSLNKMISDTTLQKELRKYCGYNKEYGVGATVALHMLAFAILTGCIDIYIAGVDLDYRLGYFDNRTQAPWGKVGGFDEYLEDILYNFEIINNSARQININIINTSKTPHLKNIFKQS